MITLTLPDKKELHFEKPVTSLEIAQSIGSGLAKASLAGMVNGQLMDLRAPIKTSGAFEIVTDKHPKAGEVIRHSAEHVLADAVKQIWPSAQVDVGRTDHSEKFQYDFKVEKPFTPDDLVKIEDKMNQIIKSGAVMERETMTRDEAKKLFKGMGEDLKVLRLNDIPESEEISVFRHGSFVDLCRGPHVQQLGQIGAIKLLETSASYFKGDENNQKLQRIYGVAFANAKELKAYETLQEEARKRDHRKLGTELDLFSVSDDVGPGLILWHPKGAMIRHLVETYWKEEHLKDHYNLVYTPHVARKRLWEISGHSNFYSENMYSPIEVDEQEFQLKPMNCPFHIQIYQSKLRSYKEFPLKYAELGTVYRYERSGVLHGLMRVRGFTQDDAHLFITQEQMFEEIQNVLAFIIRMFKKFGFHEYEIYLSTRPEQSVGSDENWETATEALRSALEHQKLKYHVDPGEGVFYGPKIDIKIKDSIGRMWQCSTIQADFSLPERFGLEYVASDGTRKTPIMLHRALLGSIERFFGILVEHYAGQFPFWLAPEQVRILNITDAHLDYARKVERELTAKGYRVHVDARNEKLGFKIRQAQVEKIPFTLIVGDHEVDTKTCSVRTKEQELKDQSIDQVIEMFNREES
ncbi:MAG: threonine--tRNA ligase [Bdellovibrionales bacterium]|nr:threonine--tRNA ligase [Bdellovibrionales bacterium]